MLPTTLTLLGTAAPFGPAPGDALSGLWPQPAFASASGSATCLVNRGNFAFETMSKLSSKAHERLEAAFSRTRRKIYGPEPPSSVATTSNGTGGKQLLHTLTVYVASDDLALDVSTNETYRISIRGASDASLRAQTVYGAIRGLETFAQLTTRQNRACASSAGGGKAGVGLNSSSVTIHDAPRFRWRGVMLDTARHFLPVRTMLHFLDAMEMNKLNVLHWHITDSQSFPLRTNRTPALALGAYDPSLTYSSADVRQIVASAADRGIRVVPELDSPGHATSWAAGYPSATLHACQTLDPAANATYILLDALIGEVAELFPDRYLHIGAVAYAGVEPPLPAVLPLPRHLPSCRCCCHRCHHRCCCRCCCCRRRRCCCCCCTCVGLRPRAERPLSMRLRMR